MLKTEEQRKHLEIPDDKALIYTVGKVTNAERFRVSRLPAMVRKFVAIMREKLKELCGELANRTSCMLRWYHD